MSVRTNFLRNDGLALSQNQSRTIVFATKNQPAKSPSHTLACKKSEQAKPQTFVCFAKEVQNNHKKPHWLFANPPIHLPNNERQEQQRPRQEWRAGRPSRCSVVRTLDDGEVSIYLWGGIFDAFNTCYQLAGWLALDVLSMVL